VVNSWPGGYQLQLTVASNGTAPATGWTAGFSLGSPADTIANALGGHRQPVRRDRHCLERQLRRRHPGRWIGHLGNDCQRRQPGAIGPVLRSLVSALICHPAAFRFPSRQAAANQMYIVGNTSYAQNSPPPYGLPGNTRCRVLPDAATARRAVRAPDAQTITALP
jgi:hypothetical protein